MRGECMLIALLWASVASCSIINVAPLHNSPKMIYHHESLSKGGTVTINGGCAEVNGAGTKDGYISYAIYDYSYSSMVGKSENHARISCCTEQNIGDGFVCSDSDHKAGLLIGTGLETVEVERGDLPNNECDVVVIKSMPVDYAGIYEVRLEGACGEPVVNFEGTIIFKSPHGYLPANEYPLLIFYGIMTALYAVVTLLWLIQQARFYDDILRLQLLMGTVVGLGIVSMSMTTADLDYWNSHGRRSRALHVCSVVISVFQHTFARLLLIIVAMGFGITKPHLGDALEKKIVTLGLSYFALAFVHDMGQGLAQSGEVHEQAPFFLTMGIAVVDSIVIWWTLTSMTKTMNTLSIRNMQTKLRMYQILFRTLVGVTSMAVLLIVGLAVVNFTVSPGDKWEYMWLTKSIWPLLFFLLLCTILWLWRPTSNNTRYAYSALEDDENDSSPTNNHVSHGARDGNFGDLKMRSMNPRNGGDDENLKWVEDNLGGSTSRQRLEENAIIGIDEDEDEVFNTRLEISKMD
eukprot:Clim_evm10s167 gene=Clim_evmTU10s167